MRLKNSRRLVKMEKEKHTIIILVADDDPDDRLLIQDAFSESRIINPVHFVNDGQELIDYLNRRHRFQKLQKCPLPGLILLDLNMPRKNGMEALKEIKSNSKHRCIPVVVFTTSKAEEDVFQTYNLGVNSFVTKPVNFDKMVDLMETISKYWFEIVELPQ
jgi:CheY-like chemotaxis protein